MWGAERGRSLSKPLGAVARAAAGQPQVGQEGWQLRAGIQHSPAVTLRASLMQTRGLPRRPQRWVYCVPHLVPPSCGLRSATTTGTSMSSAVNKPPAASLSLTLGFQRFPSWSLCPFSPEEELSVLPESGGRW